MIRPGYRLEGNVIHLTKNPCENLNKNKCEKIKLKNLK